MKIHPFKILILLAASFIIALAQNSQADASPEVKTRELTSHKLCDLSDERIDESSGIVASRRYTKENLLWTHNDSGGKPQLFLLNLQGQTVAEVQLEGAQNVDWEDIAATPDFIYVADIGDNARKRANIVIYRIREPELDPQKTLQVLNVPCERITLTYPDGAYDAETLIVTPMGELIIVTKSIAGSLIFKTPQPFADKSTQQLAQAGKYSFGASGWRGLLATGGDLSTDGKYLVVCTYTHLYQWTLPRDKTNDPWAAVWQSTPLILSLPQTKQSEAICYSADGKKLFLTSEGRPAPLYELQIVADAQLVASPSVVLPSVAPAGANG